MDAKTERRQRLVEIFEDTQNFYEQNTQLANAVQAAKNATKLYDPEDYPEISELAQESAREAGQEAGQEPVKETAKDPDKKQTGSLLKITKHKTFQAAMEIHSSNPTWKIAVLNFASATNPGGGVRTGSSAQEESLCRCSTLYPTLTQDWLWRDYYKKNRDAHDNLHTDACIYSPNIIICKTDEDYPSRMPEKDWVRVDVITCAAPNLRQRPGNMHNPAAGVKAVSVKPEELYELHLRRAKHIMHIAAAHGVDALILGAFGCGAFANDPNVVARAYRDALTTPRTSYGANDGINYGSYFKLIEFAIYCRAHETENYDAFKRAFQAGTTSQGSPLKRTSI